MYLEISNPMDYHVALYIRLSKEDESEGPSESVTNQKSLLNEFVQQHRLSVYDTYIDDEQRQGQLSLCCCGSLALGCLARSVASIALIKVCGCPHLPAIRLAAIAADFGARKHCAAGGAGAGCSCFCHDIVLSSLSAYRVFPFDGLNI